MFLYFCAFVFSAKLLVVFGGGNQCFKQDILHKMVRNWELRHPPFRSVMSLGPVDCAGQCKLHTLCHYVNFNIETLNCSLISTHENHDGIANPANVMIDVNSWDENILHGCKNHQCPNNTICKENNPGFECEPIGCTGLPQEPNINATSFTTKVLWEFDEIIEYACNRGYFTATNVTCTSDGSWSDVNCKRYSRCTDTEVCSESEVQNKELLFYLTAFNSWQKVFCRYVNSFSMFISLPEYNTASTPIYKRNDNSCELIEDTSPTINSMGYTDFQKVKNTLHDGRIKTINFAFSNSSFSSQEYGKAGDCYAGNDSNVCGVIGHFIINFRGTGFKVKSSVQWTTWGTDGVIQNITWSDDGRVIEGYCGGNCGGCEPNGGLYLEVDQNYTPAVDSAELPICKFPMLI